MLSPTAGSSLHYSFYEGRTCSTKGLNSVRHSDLADRLTNLYAHSSIAMGHNAIKLCLLRRSRIHIKTTGPCTKGFDWRCQLDLPVEVVRVRFVAGLRSMTVAPAIALPV